MPELNSTFLAKDFIETTEGLYFAVVQSGAEKCAGQDKILCFLRYIQPNAERKNDLRKVSTDEANAYLNSYYPHYLHYSVELDANLHAVDIEKICRHHRPRQRLQDILSSQNRDSVEEDVVALCGLFEECGLDVSKMGVTGSLLIAAQQPQSDIDLVLYDRDLFHKTRGITLQLIQNGQLGELKSSDWQESFARRSCSLDMEQYIWHERRKFNKALINGRKFDLNLVTGDIEKSVNYHKLGNIKVQSKVTDDWFSYDYPALYAISHDEIKTVACFIATYTGQALIGETIEISGLLEQSEQGGKRIVVGSSREAPGEYIKVIHA